MKLSDICMNYIYKTMSDFEKEIGDNFHLTSLFFNNQRANIQFNVTCKKRIRFIYISQLLYKKAFLYKLINLDELCKYAFLHNLESICVARQFNIKNFTIEYPFEFFKFDDIVDEIPMDKLKYIALCYPSLKIIDKCISTSVCNKLLLQLVRILYDIQYGNLSKTMDIEYMKHYTGYNYATVYYYYHYIKKSYFDVIKYLLKLNKEHYIAGTTHLLPYNVNDCYTDNSYNQDGSINDEYDINIHHGPQIVGRNIFHLSNNYPELLTILLDYCGDNHTLVNQKDSNNDTPFYLACCSEKYKINTECVILFLKYGANVEDVDNNGTKIWNYLKIDTIMKIIELNIHDRTSSLYQYVDADRVWHRMLQQQSWYH